MYCTGGIRCEYFSAKLKQSGFKKVYKLQGGVQHYGNTYARRVMGDEEESAQAPTAAAEKTTEGQAEGAAPSSGSPHWKGSLFVFDRRVQRQDPITRRVVMQQES